jgi:rhodanese-related sulfurtransferase
MIKIRFLTLLLLTLSISGSLNCYNAQKKAAPPPPPPPPALPAVKEAAEEAPPYKDQKDERRLSIDELKAAFDKGEVLIVDVRSEESFKRGHIKGAISVPLDKIEEQKIPSEKKIVTYCSCPAEQTSGKAVDDLIKRGYKNVAALVGGYEAWVDKGYPVEKAN